MPRKYIHKSHLATTKRLAKCGHMSKEGRYFQCEKCVPVLEPEDKNPDIIYFADDSLEEEYL